MKFYKVYRKYFFNRDTFFATISVFLVIGLFGLIPLNTNILNPIKTALDDFEFTDLAYAKLGKNNEIKLDDRQLIVNVGWLDRAEIALLLQQLNKSGAKAIGLDVQFETAKDPAADSLLQQTFQSIPNLVAASHIVWNGDTASEEKGFFEASIPRFGFVNFIAEDKSTIRYFSPFENGTNSIYESFSAALVKTIDSNAYKKLRSRKVDVETIHYTRKTNRYLVVDGKAILEGRVDTNAIKNKVVLVGYVSDKKGDVEDKHFTPMNPRFVGKALPDMNGIVIHANIISMILDHDYIRKVPAWFNWLITILIAWLHMILFIRYYIENHIWFHLVAKIAQMVSAIFFVYLGIMFFHLFALKIDFKISLIVIVLAIDVIYFYEAIAIWMNKKFSYKTVFTHNTH